MADQQTDSRDQDDESVYEFLAKKRRGYLTAAATMIILFGIACIVLPLLPAQSEEQQESDPTVLFVVGPLLIIVGTVWLVKRIKRDGFHPNTAGLD